VELVPGLWKKVRSITFFLEFSFGSFLCFKTKKRTGINLMIDEIHCGDCEEGDLNITS
jgi:hypothetical protein